MTDYMFTYSAAEDDEGNFVIIDNEGSIVATAASANLACVIAAQLLGMCWTLINPNEIQVWY